jgi:hypothetical protein
MSGLIAEAEEARQQASAWLIPVAGPPLEAFKLDDTPGGLVLGRADTAQLKVPVNADKVSRNHARFTCVGGTWSVIDSSRWGTYVNGIKLDQGAPVALREGDAVKVAPWTFTFSFSPPRAGGLDNIDDTAVPAADVRAVDEASARLLASNLVELLTNSTELIHAARSEKELAETLISVALKGTGLSNGAVLKVLDAAGRVEPIATHMTSGTSGQPLFSRSLVARAKQGQVVEHRVDAMSGGNAALGESVMQMKISAAICAPLLIGDGSAPAGERDVAALLYLDARGAVADTSRINPNAAGFTMALARIGSLALANLKRIEMALRVRETQHDLEAAAEAQRLIFPARSARFGPFSYHGESKPGQSVGGDFFDVIPVTPTKLAVALGDVTGKGIPASVLMTAAFGFLHARLEAGLDVQEAATSLNRFLNPRRHSSRFVTLWMGIFDLEARKLTYVDCGHGWACMQHPDGSFESLDRGGGLPCGIDDEWAYTAATTDLKPGSRAIIVSDGFIEQQGLITSPEGRPMMEQWGMPGLQNALKTRPPQLPLPVGSAPPSSVTSDDLKHLYDSLVSYAGTTQLSDDATAILVRWD